MILKSINPFTNELIAETPELTAEEVDKILINSVMAFEGWKRTSYNHRSVLMRKAAENLRMNTGRYASVITSEMGKPLSESMPEVEKCAWVCEYYAENAPEFLKRWDVDTDANSSYVVYDPLGSILGIMPWNFPFWQVFRFAVPTLMAGNTVVLKHASNVQMCARTIENIFSEAGFPASSFVNLAVGSGEMSRVIEHDAIKAVSLTGSEAAGRKVAGTAGRVLKKCVLELGGSNAFIVLEDADLGKAVETAIQARFQNAGQSCIAAKRFIVHEKVSEEFISDFREGIRNINVGDPADPDIRMGPLCSVSQAEAVEDQLRRSVERGARLVEGGKRDGAIIRPALVLDVMPGMPLFDEEIFGPVAPVTIAGSIEEAIRLACKTTFGLGVSLFTNDIEKAEQLAREFQDGAVFINGLVKSDPRLPFGGTGRSGYGRELSLHGIREFVNVRSVWVKKF
ncbi:MAG TPA: NAD-dependent succinate-semialdehyde dehydrogenase [Bacteroidales bacterium]|nr:NAD-dependent succinate-semialdehyde dehydrogenase [Bacteroidales bacterium]